MRLYEKSTRFGQKTQGNVFSGFVGHKNVETRIASNFLILLSLEFKWLKNETI